MTAQSQNKPAAKIISFTTRGNNKPVSYVLTDADYLTLARAVEYEGPPQSIVAWTLIQRFAFLYPIYPTLDKFIQAYAQPVNPRWFPDGDLHIQWLAKLKNAKRTVEANTENLQATRRLAKASIPLARISAKTIHVIEDVFAKGAASPVPGSVHYRAPTVQTTDVSVAERARADFAVARKLLDTVKVGDPRTDNWFFSEIGASNVRVALLAKNIGNIAVIALCLAGAAYLIYRNYYA